MLEGSDFRFGADEENRRERLSGIHKKKTETGRIACLCFLFMVVEYCRLNGLKVGEQEQLMGIF